MELDTIVIGDCLDMMKNMPDECVDLIVTDPPYNASHNSLTVKGICGPDYTTIKEGWDLNFNPEQVWPDLLRVSRQGVLFTSHHILERWLFLMKESGSFKQILHLQKTNPIPTARRFWRFTTQYGLWWAKPSCTFNKQFAGKDVLMYSAGHTGILWHPTSKPLTSMESIIRVHSNEGDLVFDPFMGSSTTAVAALKLGRHFYGCDINPEYVELANKRIEKAKLEMAQLSFSV